jgi:hypothetical protein
LVLALAVGRSVTNSGRARQTEYTLKVLDAALSEYIHSQETMPRSWVVGPGSMNRTYPILDGIGDLGAVQNLQLDSVGLFLLQLKGLPHLEAKLRDLDAKLVREMEFDGQRIVTVLDGWGRPIRYVHPQFHGLIHGTAFPSSVAEVSTRQDKAQVAQVVTFPPSANPGISYVRRNNVVTPDDLALRMTPDSDGGMATGRPYFYSTGADGKAGYAVRLRQPGDPGNLPWVVDVDFNADNVYSRKPQFQMPNDVEPVRNR